jgi:hypothetical protein
MSPRSASLLVGVVWSWMCLGCGTTSDGDQQGASPSAVAQVKAEVTLNGPATLRDGRYQISVTHTGMCLDVPWGTGENGALLQQVWCSGNRAQLFDVERVDGNFYRIRTALHGKAFDIADQNKALSARLQQWEYWGSHNQHWSLDQQPDGSFLIRARHSGLALDVEGASLSEGAKIVQWSVTGTPQQRWKFVPEVIGGGGVKPPINKSWPGIARTNAGKWVRVRNSCPFPLWLHSAGSAGVLQPDDKKLDPGQSHDFLAPNEWSAARVTAFTDGPRMNELEKAEMTITNGVLNYNVTYVDWVGLPLEIYGAGGDCNASHFTGCYASSDAILNGCPEGFLRDGRKCISPRTWCMDTRNQSHSLCHALDGAIASCAQCPKASTPDVYACSGPYANEPRWCAALNRAMTHAPDSSDASQFYRRNPHNSYARWVHQVCPDIYAFSYDDWLSHGGFRSCRGDELRITFCPAN